MGSCSVLVKPESPSRMALMRTAVAEEADVVYLPKLAE